MGIFYSGRTYEGKKINWINTAFDWGCRTMKSSKLFLLVFVMVGLTPVSVYGGAKESPQPSEVICYKVIYEANFNELNNLLFFF